MRKLTTKQLERLRDLAVTSLEFPACKLRITCGMAPEDLVVACDRALGWDAMEDEEMDEKRALVETSHQRCAAAWKLRRGDQLA